MSKMNPDVKTKWVAELRSGKYKQGQGALRRTDGTMCCLGVLCHILAPEHWTGPGESKVNPDCYRHQGVIDMPSQEICALAGFPSEFGYRRLDQRSERVVSTPKVAINDNYDFLWALNDGGATFAEIADAIESQL